MKIGICNVQGEISQRFGIPYDVPEQFRRFLAIAIPDLSVREYKVLESEFPLSLDESDAYLITGSPAGVYDNSPWVEPLSHNRLQFKFSRFASVKNCYFCKLSLSADLYNHSS
jgi:hypothetical protein